MEYGAKIIWLGKSLSRNPPIFSEFDVTVEDGFLTEEVLEEETIHSHDKALLLSMSGFLKLVQRKQGVRNQAKRVCSIIQLRINSGPYRGRSRSC